MPMYEYRCQECATVFETLVRAGDVRDKESGPRCPRCGSTALTKLISASAIRVGGGGLGTVGGSCSAPPGSGFS